MNNLKKLAISFGISPKLVYSNEVKYSPDCNADNGIMGKYQPLNNTIYLMEVDDEYIFSTYVHELTHARQRQKLGIVLYFLCLGLFRFVLERQARKAGEKAEDWVKTRNTRYLVDKVD